MVTRTLQFCAVLTLAATTVWQSSAQSATVVNGNFEDVTDWGAVGSTTGPFGWPPTYTENPASPQTGTEAIGGSGTSALLAGGPEEAMGQIVVTGGPTWQFNMDFAVQDPGGASSRTLDLAWDLPFAGGLLGRVFMRVVDLDDDGAGDIQFHDPTAGGWTTVEALRGSITFDPDVTVSPLVNHLRLVPHPSFTAYEVELTNGSATVFHAIEIPLFNNPSLAAETPQSITLFNPAGGNGSVLVDNISLDSPTSAVPGDFDSDGDVDGADFVAWQTNFPTASGATLAEGDADADGDVDGADFVVWQTNFPFTPGSGTAPVPEPAGLLLISVALACGAFWRGRWAP